MLISCRLITRIIPLFLAILGYHNFHAQSFFQSIGTTPLNQWQKRILVDDFAVNSNGTIMFIKHPIDKRMKVNDLYVSTDAGRSWQDVAENIPAKDYLYPPYLFPRTIFAVDHVFFLVSGAGNVSPQRIYRSQDEGKSWETLFDVRGTLLSNLEEIKRYCHYHSSEKIYLEAGDNLAYTSSDYGTTLSETKRPPKAAFIPKPSLSGMSRYRDPKFWRGKGEKNLISAEEWDKIHPEKYHFSDAFGFHIADHLRGNNVIYGMAVIDGIASGAIVRDHVVRSTDNGLSWKVVEVDEEVTRLLFMDCNDNIYVQTKSQAFYRSSHAAKSWEKLEGLPDNKYDYTHTLGADNTLYFFTEGQLYASKEPICCSKGEKQKPPQNDPCTSITLPDLSPIITTIKPHQGQIGTDAYASKGDYVCVVAKGEILLSSGRPFEAIKITSKGVKEWKTDTTKQYAEYNFGQLLISHGDITYPASEFTLKDEDCDAIGIQKNLMQIGVFEGYGDYFIAEYDGVVALEINNTLPNSKIGGNFQVEIYVLDKEAHLRRNCFNRCPRQEPRVMEGANFDSTDGENNWKNGNGIADVFAEECYHGGNEDYRGRSAEVAGCQCVYDDNGVLINDNKTAYRSESMGTFDYGYIDDPKATFLHFILDVFPHILYFQKQNIPYVTMPDSRSY